MLFAPRQGPALVDPATDAWSYRARMPTSRSGMAGALMAGRIFMFGGEETGRD